jgi:hypothetical protein
VLEQLTKPIQLSNDTTPTKFAFVCEINAIKGRVFFSMQKKIQFKNYFKKQHNLIINNDFFIVLIMLLSEL